ncbi:hypothetical protein [Ruegeria arenilitoris]|uniref:hypothetical protein n=1 Tax=Ruegeria arenilitoris TaxID=1173585 RepID=UPI00147B4A16|nr:hypothetical protein [Ruegeria arenilitoris]
MKVSEIVPNILGDLSDEIGDGIASVGTFAKNQSENIAELAVIITRERATGILKTNNQMFNRFIERL